MIKRLLAGLAVKIGWWFAPPRCPLCQNVVRPFCVCEECAAREKSLRLAENHPSIQVPGVQAVFARWRYQDEIRHAILRMKFENMPYQAENLILLLFCEPHAYNFARRFNIIVWVPATKSKEQQRGYNVPHLLAKSLSDMTGVPLAKENVLRKVKETPNQVELSGKQRRENLRAAFSVTAPQEIAGKSVLLVDDVITTGTTLRRVAETLKQAGAKEVSALVLAESVPKTQKETID